jgi:uncharacterized membrane protein
LSGDDEVNMPKASKNSGLRKHHQRMKERQLDRVTHPGLAPVIERNIRAIAEHREEAEKSRSTEERIADGITWFSGRMPFVYFHAAWFTVWIVMNLGLFGLPVFDPFPYGLLTMIVSLEAIFLSTFVLVSQNRQAALAERRVDLDLQTNLLAEYEVTRILTLLDAVVEHLGLEVEDPELKELEKDVEPHEVLNELENHDQHTKNGKS